MQLRPGLARTCHLIQRSWRFDAVEQCLLDSLGQCFALRLRRRVNPDTAATYCIQAGAANIVASSSNTPPAA
jgi:hypothetical protein